MRRRHAAGLAGLLACACALACAEINSQTNSYATLEEARRAGAVASGYVPSWLPAGSHDLREAHVPNSTSLWGIVNFPQDQADQLRSGLNPEELTLDGVLVDMPRRIEWWPQELRGTLNGERLSVVGIRGYRSRAGGLIVAVNWSQGRAYYWAAQ